MALKLQILSQGRSWGARWLGSWREVFFQGGPGPQKLLLSGQLSGVVSQGRTSIYASYHPTKCRLGFPLVVPGAEELPLHL